MHLNLCTNFPLTVEQDLPVSIYHASLSPCPVPTPPLLPAPSCSHISLLVAGEAFWITKKSFQHLFFFQNMNMCTYKHSSVYVYVHLCRGLRLTLDGFFNYFPIFETVFLTELEAPHEFWGGGVLLSLASHAGIVGTHYHSGLLASVFRDRASWSSPGGAGTQSVDQITLNSQICLPLPPECLTRSGV